MGRLLEPKLELEGVGGSGDFRGFFAGALSLAECLASP